VERLSAGEARRVALAAQGFDGARPARVTATSIAAAIRRMGVLQLDPINVLAPAHYLTLFARLGAYRREHFAQAVYESGRFTEQWAHEASIVPVETWPLLQDRRETFRIRPYGMEQFLEEKREWVDSVLEKVRREGALGAERLEPPRGAEERIPGAWFDRLTRFALEAHFARGRLVVRERRSDFSRVYDLAERVLPAKILAQRVEKQEAHRGLLAIAARAHGVATAGDLSDYFRMSIGETRPRLAEMVKAGALLPVEVEGWREPAYLDPGAKMPEKVEAASLISPFDPLVWTRPRAERLFGFHYRVEIYVPKEKRKWGYYVMPFLLGDRLVARADLKAEREAGVLRVVSWHVEAGVKKAEVAGRLREELAAIAKWLTLERVEGV
jgi:hypothetical protein